MPVTSPSCQQASGYGKADNHPPDPAPVMIAVLPETEKGTDEDDAAMIEGKT